MDGIGEVANLTVNAGAKAFASQLIKQGLKLTFAAAHDWRVDDDALPGRNGKDPLYDLLGCLPRNGFAALRAVRHTDRCVEQAQIVVELGDSADCGSGTAAGGFLFDRDGRAEPFDGIDIGALDLVEELAGVGGESFYVASLAFGIDGVKGQGRLT